MITKIRHTSLRSLEARSDESPADERWFLVESGAQNTPKGKMRALPDISRGDERIAVELFCSPGSNALAFNAKDAAQCVTAWRVLRDDTRDHELVFACRTGTLFSPALAIACVTDLKGDEAGTRCMMRCLANSIAPDLDALDLLLEAAGVETYATDMEKRAKEQYDARGLSQKD